MTHLRHIFADAARDISGTGRVIGLCAASSNRRGKPRLIDGVLDMAAAIGIGHFTIESDMAAGGRPSRCPTPCHHPALATALLGCGLASADAAGVITGSMLRVINAAAIAR